MTLIRNKSLQRQRLQDPSKRLAPVPGFSGCIRCRAHFCHNCCGSKHVSKTCTCLTSAVDACLCWIASKWIYHLATSTSNLSASCSTSAWWSRPFLSRRRLKLTFVGRYLPSKSDPCRSNTLTFEIHVHTTQEGFWSWRRNAIPLLGPCQRSAIVSASSAWAHICLLLDFILLECVTWSCRISAEAPLKKHSWNRSRAPARLVAKEADTKNCSQNCVFGPCLESVFWAQKWVLWLHTSISLAQKRAWKTHPKASPENLQLFAPCWKKISHTSSKIRAHLRTKPLLKRRPLMVPRGAVPDKTWTRTFLPSACPHAEEADTVSASSAWAHICLLLDFILLECVTWSCRISAEAPLNKHSWNSSRAPARLVAKEADTKNCSQNCVFGPCLESVFWAQKWVLWLHTSISLAQKRAWKTHPKASPENLQLFAPCWKKISHTSSKIRAHLRTKPLLKRRPLMVPRGAVPDKTWTRTFLPSACPHAEADTMTEHSKGTQDGAKPRPQNKLRNLEHQAMRGNKTVWKTGEDHVCESKFYMLFQPQKRAWKIEQFNDIILCILPCLAESSGVHNAGTLSTLSPLWIKLQQVCRLRPTPARLRNSGHPNCHKTVVKPAFYIPSLLAECTGVIKSKRFPQCE